MHDAAYYGECKVAKVLLKRGADIHMQRDLAKLVSQTIRNENIEKLFESVVLNLNFPIYCSSLYEVFEVGKRRRMLEDKAKQIFWSLQDENNQLLPKLPEVVTVLIINYLDNEDLNNFTSHK